jgi:hypothetical protein
VYPVELVVRLSGYRVLRATQLAIIGSADPAGFSPLAFTVDEMPAYLNGSRPYPTTDGSTHAFHLLLPTYGFTVDLTLLERGSGSAIDRGTLSLTADRPAGAAAPGTNLASHLAFESGPTLKVPSASWTIGEQDAFPAGPVTLTLSATRTDGRGFKATLLVETATVALDAEHDPFSRPMSWLFRFDQDLFTTTATVGTDGAIVLTTQPGPDGVPDFEQEVRPFGGQGPDATLNAVYLGWIQREILREVRRFYGIAPDGTPVWGIKMDFFVAGEPGAPDPASFKTDGEFSMLRFGGTMDPFLGRSLFSIYNHQRVDDTTPDLGIASAKIIQLASGTLELAHALDPYRADRGGHPVGADPLDAMVLDPSFDRWSPANSAAQNDRFDALSRLAFWLGLAIANVTAHEMGHALGLMPDDAPPNGFFANRPDVAFMDPLHTNSHHSSFPNLNLMRAGGFLSSIAGALGNLAIPPNTSVVDLLTLLGKENRLEPYSKAYLQGRLSYRAFDGVHPGD